MFLINSVQIHSQYTTHPPPISTPLGPSTQQIWGTKVDKTWRKIARGKECVQRGWRCEGECITVWENNVQFMLGIPILAHSSVCQKWHHLWRAKSIKDRHLSNAFSKKNDFFHLKNSEDAVFYTAETVSMPYIKRCKKRHPITSSGKSGTLFGRPVSPRRALKWRLLIW